MSSRLHASAARQPLANPLVRTSQAATSPAGDLLPKSFCIRTNISSNTEAMREGLLTSGLLVVILLREPARPAAIREHRLAPWFAVGAVCFGAFMGQLDASVVTVAFPALQRQFGAGLAAVQWVSLAYLLALTTLLVPAGRWSDRVGRKLLYLYGFVVFAAASAGC